MALGDRKTAIGCRTGETQEVRVGSAKKFFPQRFERIQAGTPGSLWKLIFAATSTGRGCGRDLDLKGVAGPSRFHGRAKSEAAMKILVLVALTVLGSIPALAQDQASCKAFFQVLRADAGMPGLRIGLDRGQKRWWESEGQKKYPGLCLNGSVTSGDRPRYLVIWSTSDSIGQASLPSNEVFGQTTGALQATAPTARIYQPRWDLASVTVVNVLYDGKPMLPPVYFEADYHARIVRPDSRKVLDAAVKYLSQERVFLPNPN
jgi:hypothetical protein